MRSAQEVAYRLLCLYGVVGAAYSRPPERARRWVETSGVARHLTPLEAEFVASDDPPEGEIGAASWRTEAAQVLAWALGLLAELPAGSQKADLTRIGITREVLEEPDRFVSAAALRSREELETMRGEVESQHWGQRAGPAGRALFGHPATEDDLDPGIIYQRHYALNWILDGQEWDEVSTDT